jgi:hypothetical protein
VKNAQNITIQGAYKTMGEEKQIRKTAHEIKKY